MMNTRILLAVIISITIIGGLFFFGKNIFTGRSNTVIGVLYKGTGFKDVVDGFTNELGSVDAKGKKIEYLITEVSGTEQKDFDEAAQALVNQKVDLIFAVALEPITAAKKTTETNHIPVVFALGGNPVSAGFVEDFQPDGNLTGVTWLAWELSGKRLQILKNIIPGLKNILIVGKKGSVATTVSLENLDPVAKRLGITITPLEISTVDELRDGLATVLHGDVDAIFYAPDPFLQRSSQLFIDHALKEKIPIMFHEERFVRNGATFAYGPNFSDAGKAAAETAEKILFQRLSPKDIPVKTILETHLSINLATAKKIDIPISDEVLSSAEVLIRE